MTRKAIIMTKIATPHDAMMHLFSTYIALRRVSAAYEFSAHVQHVHAISDLSAIELWCYLVLLVNSIVRARNV